MTISGHKEKKKEEEHINKKKKELNWMLYEQDKRVPNSKTETCGEERGEAIKNKTKKKGGGS
jgi:hypothetical protein